jgi:hypothetical protein
MRCLLAIVFVLALPATASASQPVSLSSSLADQLQQARSELQESSEELSSSQKRQPMLFALQKMALRKAPQAAREVALARLRAARAKQRLNRITIDYIRLVQSFGGSSGAATSEQRLLQYLGSVSSKDAALVITQGETILDHQNQVMEKVRAAAGRLQSQQAKLQQAAGRQQTVRFQATGAVLANQQRMAVLRGNISLQKRQVSELESRLGVLTAGQGGGVLTGGQVMFSFYLAELSGLDINLIKAWVLAEMSSSYAAGRQSEGNHNWLNIGYFDSLGGGGAFQDLPAVWSDPRQAAQASQAFLQGDFLGASPGIQRILSSGGSSVESQIRSIATSGWASSGYGGGSSLRGTYKLVPKTTQPPRISVRWRSPKDKRWYLLGQRLP